jgi:PAT family beta-lactamase induction signal transducer AmpG
MPAPTDRPAHPWCWVPSLYFAQGVPYVVVMTASVVMYKNLGVSNTEIALWTSWLHLPWVLKPLWSPLIELLGTKRRWIAGMQFMVAISFAAVALALPAGDAFRVTIALLWLMAFASATHDIAADGFYMLALPAHTQSAFVGVRSTCYRLAMIAGQGALVVLAGRLTDRLGDAAAAWAVVFVLLAAGFALAALWHGWALPRPILDVPAPGGPGPGWAEYGAILAAFFRQPDLVRVLAFLLLYRFAESQLLKLVAPFLLDPRSAGGLGLSTEAVGIAYGTVGVVALTAGGLLGGWTISRSGLRRLLWPLALAINGPNLVYVGLAWAQPQSLVLVSAAVAVEQFGYGFGFCAYMVYMLMVAAGPPEAPNPHRSAHYALCTGFMALGMMLPGMASGWLQAQWGYPGFFVWVCIATLPSFAATAWVRVDPQFGRKPG